MDKIRLGFALCGSFCTFAKVVPQMQKFVDAGYDVYPIMSDYASQTDTRFGTAEHFRTQIEDICGKSVICTIKGAEPIGPKALLDVLVVAPCTGNTLGKLANGVTDTSVTMACKAHLRNARPVVIAVSTNDGLGAAARNIGMLQNARNIFFVPYAQDDCIRKPASLVADFDAIDKTVELALKNEQLQPVLMR